MNRLLLIFCLFFSIGINAQIISEICPSNVTVFETVHEGYSDWVEVYNNTGAEIELEDFFLTDDLNVLTKWQGPDITVADNAYLVLSASEVPTDSETIPFSFSKKGGKLYFVNQSNIVIDSIVYGALSSNHSYGRIDDNYYYFKTPTPNLMNALSTGYNGYTKSPEINRLSGSYKKGTNIILYKENSTESIYYSLNGTDPTTSFLYDSPIVLDKTVSLKAVAVGDSLIPSVPIYRTYFVGVSHELPVINLNVDSLELLDETVGIYVLGPDADEDFPFYGANFWKDIEIPVYYEYFNKEFSMLEALNCGIKIHGGTISSTRPMKSLRLIAHDRNVKSEFTQRYFPNKSKNKFKRLLLRNSGSDFNKTHLKDGVLHQFILEHDLNVDVQGYQPVVVYINGLYWGIHNMREKIDKYYPYSNYDIDPETVNLLEEGDLRVISGDSLGFVALRDYVFANDMNVAEKYDWVSEHLDLESMVDYFIMELYVNNRDWPYNNLKLWNSSEFPKWRYFYSDLDAGFRYYPTAEVPFHYNSLEYILGPYGDDNVHVAVFKKMLSNTEFKRYFINRYSDLLNTILSGEYMLNYIYKAKSKLDPEMRRHFYKWWGYIDQWNANFLKYDDFLKDRVEIIQAELSFVFEKPVSTPIYIGMYPSSGGEVKLNTIKLDSFPFIGAYYPENKIDLTVLPNEGKQFLYWENLRTGEKLDAEHILIEPTQGDSIIAIFESKETSFDLVCFPNPVTRYAEFNFSVPISGEIRLELLSLNGEYLATLSFDYLAKGSYAREFSFDNLIAGTYLFRIVSKEASEGIKFVKL